MRRQAAKMGIEGRLDARPADLQDMFSSLLVAETCLLDRPVRNSRNRRRRREAVLKGVCLVVDAHVNLAAAMDVEDRVAVCVKRVILLQGGLVVLLKDEQVADIEPAFFQKAEQVGDHGLLAQLKAVKRRSLDRRKDNGFHVILLC